MLLFLLPVRKEKIISIHRAKRRHMNALGGNAGIDQLIAVRLMQINPRVAFFGRGEEFV